MNRIFSEPAPFRHLIKVFIKRFALGNYSDRLRLGAVPRPHYGYCVYHAADLAKRLGISKISVLEFGVAGGNGLVNLEYHASEVRKALGVEVDIYGFDTGEGLPAPTDYRDLPYHWQAGFFKMDYPALQKSLKSARLVIGRIEETGAKFFSDFNPAPIGAIAFDFDYYTATVHALRMLEVDPAHYLPRVFCYADDIIGDEISLYNDFTGERLAINEFNQTHHRIKLSPAYHLFARKIIEPWYYNIFICHFFDHPLYNTFVSESNQQLSLPKAR